jgi:hypothetical protein
MDTSTPKWLTAELIMQQSFRGEVLFIEIPCSARIGTKRLVRRLTLKDISIHELSTRI